MASLKQTQEFDQNNHHSCKNHYKKKKQFTDQPQHNKKGQQKPAFLKSNSTKNYHPQTALTQIPQYEEGNEQSE